MKIKDLLGGTVNIVALLVVINSVIVAVQSQRQLHTYDNKITKCEASIPRDHTCELQAVEIDEIGLVVPVPRRSYGLFGHYPANDQNEPFFKEWQACMQQKLVVEELYKLSRPETKELP